MSKRSEVKAGKHERIRKLLTKYIKPQCDWSLFDQEPGEDQAASGSDRRSTGKETAFPGHPKTTMG